jgi:hypothetical protein
MGKTIFAQLLEHLPKREFRRCVARYRGEKGVKSFSCWDQLLTMLFAQLTYRDSLRDIEICLRSMEEKLYRVGLRSRVSRSTLADANESRSSRVYADFCRVLMRKAHKLYLNDPFEKLLGEVVYVLDSTYISLCLSLFPWAKLGGQQAEVKIHSLLDLRGSIPSFIAITGSKYRDNHMLDSILIEPGAFYIMDRAYLDCARLSKINRSRGYFVVRPKKGIFFQRIYSRSVDKNIGLRSDQTVRFLGKVSRAKYSDQLRLIRYVDLKKQKRLAFLTNNFSLPAFTICQLYKERWQIEVFFKWIKQNLRIKTFYGNSLNAVETQIWIAISSYLLVAIVKKSLKIDAPLYRILQFLSVSLFEEKPIFQAFYALEQQIDAPIPTNQLSLF